MGVGRQIEPLNSCTSILSLYIFFTFIILSLLSIQHACHHNNDSNTCHDKPMDCCDFDASNGILPILLKLNSLCDVPNSDVCVYLLSLHRVYIEPN